MERIPEEWFGGNFKGVELFIRLCTMAHTYDDLIDGDEVTKDRVHDLMYNALIDLPNNPLYRKYQPLITPLWELVFMAWKTANTFEERKENHGLEIAHGLRYSAGHIVALIMIGELGRDKALEYMPEMWKLVMYERIGNYIAEHGEF